MSSYVSIIGSGITNFSEMSLCDGSSAQITNYTSFSDYETPLMTPHGDEENDNPEIPVTPDYNYVVASQSNSALLDKIMTETKFATAIKSDTFIPQQSKAINDFMDDVFKIQGQQEQGEPNLAYAKREGPANVELWPETQSPEDDARSIDSNDRKFRAPKNTSPTHPSLAEAKHKIIENLDHHLTSEKLFTKYRACSNERSIGSKIQSKLFSNPSFLSHKSRRSRRSASIDSILRIDHELQPLNLMLSKLLAEFKAMKLKARLDQVSQYDSRMPSWKPRSVKSVAVGSESGKDFEDYVKYKEQRDAFVNFLKKGDAPCCDCYTQTSRSSGDCCPESSESWGKDAYSSSKIKPYEKNASRYRCCKRHQKRQNWPVIKRSSAIQAPKTVGEEFGREMLDEITRIDARCAEMLEEVIESHEVDESKNPRLPEDEDGSVAVRSTELGINSEEDVRWGVAGS